MGVLACDRAYCENIMCDYYSHDHGYLCSECREELIMSGPCDINLFMGTAKAVDCSILGWEKYGS
jgi:hypothetical protein